MGSAWLAGLGAAVLVALVLGVLRSILEVGMFAVSVLGGLGIGWSVRHAAWSTAHRPSARPEVAAIVSGVVAWVLGLAVAWVVALAILPGSERSLGDRLVSTPWLDWLLPQIGLADIVSLVSLLGATWVASRSAGIPAVAGD